MRRVVAVPAAAAGARLGRWRVRPGGCVRAGQLLAEWPGGRARAPLPGTVARLAVQEGAELHPGDTLLEIEPCSHPTVMKDMCADCGADLQCDDDPQTAIASVPMIHSVPELKVSQELAQKIGREDSERLLKDRKLVLLVDLDQTLIHTTNNNIPPNIKDVHHFRLRSWGPGGYGAGRWYHTRLRPGTLNFLKSITAFYELHICTFGARTYAHQVAELLDPNGELFSHRILSRDECFDIYTKTPNLKALFPCGDNLVCIIDDREDVWNGATNLIQVKPYHFFEHTGDINAPPGLGKTERDIKGQGVHFEDFQNKPKKIEKNPAVQMPSLETENAGNKVIPDKKEKMPSLETENAENKVIPDKKEKMLSLETENDGNKAVPDKKETTAEDSENIESTEINTTSDDSKKETEPVDEMEVLPEDENKNLPESTEPEKSIVKDIEKIVTQVQENFITSDSALNKIESNARADAANDKNKSTSENNTECDSSVSAMETDVDSEVQDTKTKWKMTEDGMIDVEDSDDYLLYLEEILIRIHKLFYELYDTMEAGSVPDLKTAIPQVKSKVLAGTSLVFSGLVPTHQKLENSRAYMVAMSLGAEVTQDFTDRTTHLVAVRPGTAKVHACRRVSTSSAGGTPHTVTPAWLWCCAERWQHAEEKLFPLRGGTGKSGRRPPPHCGSPPRLPQNQIQPRKRTPSGRFMDTINPLLSFSSDDIADMDKEVEDIINESDESESEDKIFSDNGNAGEPRLADTTVDFSDKDDILRNDLGNITSESEDSVESLSGGEHPHGWRPDRARKRRRSKSYSVEEDTDTGSSPPKHTRDTSSGENEDDTKDSNCDESPSVKFRRGEPLPSDGPDQNDSDTNGSVEPSDEMDDGEWNMMGAALEREFLGLDE